MGGAGPGPGSGTLDAESPCCPDQRQPGHPVGPSALGTWGRGGSTGDLQLLPTGVKGEGPHQPAERGAALHALQQLLQPPPGLGDAGVALRQALSQQLRGGAGRGDEAVQLAEAVPRPRDRLLVLGGQALQAGGQAADGDVELLDEAAGPGQCAGIWHLGQERGGEWGLGAGRGPTPGASPLRPSSHTSRCPPGASVAFSVWKEPSRELPAPAGACCTPPGVGRQAAWAPGPGPDPLSGPA